MPDLIINSAAPFSMKLKNFPIRKPQEKSYYPPHGHNSHHIKSPVSPKLVKSTPFSSFGRNCCHPLAIEMQSKSLYYDHTAFTNVINSFCSFMIYTNDWLENSFVAQPLGPIHHQLNETAPLTVLMLQFKQITPFLFTAAFFLRHYIIVQEQQ